MRIINRGILSTGTVRHQTCTIPFGPPPAAGHDTDSIVRSVARTPTPNAVLNDMHVRVHLSTHGNLVNLIHGCILGMGRTSFMSSSVVRGSGCAGARKSRIAWLATRRCLAASVSALLTVGVTRPVRVQVCGSACWVRAFMDWKVPGQK